MRFGISLQAFNTSDWERVARGDFSRPPAVPDVRIWHDNLLLGDLAEPLGFDSLWTTEHHASPYGMCPNPLLMLSYFAGRTKTIRLGTMVVVLPWHNPFKLAGEIAYTDVLLGGDRLTVGVGRGSSKREFDAHGVSRDESRGRFQESIEILRRGLTQERFSYDGDFFSIPEVSVRPRPVSRDLVDHMIGAFVSPESLEVIAESGVGPLFNGGSPPAKVATDLVHFNQIRDRLSLAPVQPVTFHWVYCCESEQEAVEKASRYIHNTNTDIGLHYGFADPSSFQGMSGYEYFERLANRLAGPDYETTIAQLADQQIVGTPKQCLEKIEQLQRLTSSREIIGLFHYGGMPLDEAKRSMRLFSAEVLPKVRTMVAPLWPEGVGRVSQCDT